MRRLLVHMDPDRGTEVLDLLYAAGQLFPNELCMLHALVINGNADALVGKVDIVFDLQDTHITSNDDRAICAIMSTLHEAEAFDAIVMRDDDKSNQVAARLAVRIGAGLVTEVTAIASTDGKCRLTRQVYGGAATTIFETENKAPLILTLKGGSSERVASVDRATQVIALSTPDLPTSGIRHAENHISRQADIRNADILISGGRGVAKDFKALQPLADALGGEISASRAIVDAGIADRSQQVGQTGQKVSPRLYMALGINGAIQHVLGLENAEHIISVNTNVNAPICSLSDLVVEGDALTFVDKMLNKIKEEQSDGTL